MIRRVQRRSVKVAKGKERKTPKDLLRQKNIQFDFRSAPMYH